MKNTILLISSLMTTSMHAEVHEIPTERHGNQKLHLKFSVTQAGVVNKNQIQVISSQGEVNVCKDEAMQCFLQAARTMHSTFLERGHELPKLSYNDSQVITSQSNKETICLSIEPGNFQQSLFYLNNLSMFLTQDCASHERLNLLTQEINSFLLQTYDYQYPQPH